MFARSRKQLYQMTWQTIMAKTRYNKLNTIVWPVLTGGIDIEFLPCWWWFVSELEFVRVKSVTCTCPSCGDLFDLSTSVSLVFFVVRGIERSDDRRRLSSWERSSNDRTSPGMGGGSSPLNLPNCGVLLRTSEESLPLDCSSTPEMDLTRLESFNIFPSKVINTPEEGGEGKGEGGGSLSGKEIGGK